MNRREFSRIVGLSALALHSLPLLAFDRSRIPLGLCNHSLRSMNLNVRQLLDFAIDQELDSLLINTLKPFDSREKAHLLSLKSDADKQNISIHVGVGSISEASSSYSASYGSPEALLLEGIRVAVEVGSPVVGCRIGSMEDRYMVGGIKSHMESVARVMKSLRNQALDAGVVFALENHCGDLRSSELLELIQHTGSDICGALFDPANALWAMEDPMKALDTLGSSIVSTSVRDVAIWETEEGATFQGKAIGEGILDVEDFMDKLARVSPGVPIHVETISNSARSIGYMKPGFWKAFPELPTSEFVDFLRIVKEGDPQEIQLPPAGISQAEFDIRLQQSELLRSLDNLRIKQAIN